MDTLKDPSEYLPALAAACKRDPHASQKLTLEKHTNRHPATVGGPWGWYEVHPLGIEVGYWGVGKDDLKGIDIGAWNARAELLSKEE